jgi:dihydroorotate dehydrogenase electron transfer subunit
MYDETVAVVENRPLTGGHFVLSLYSPRQAQATRPGQFAMVRLLGRSDVLLRRPMSIYDVVPAVAPDVAPALRAVPSRPNYGVISQEPDAGARAGETKQDAGLKPGETKQDAGLKAGVTKSGPAIIQLLYKVVGRGTRLMAALKPGDRVGLLGPLGHGFFEEEYIDRAKAADEILHVAGGIGIAALLLPARHLAGIGLQQRLFFGGRTQEDLVGVDRFKPYVSEAVLATENGSRGHHGYVTQPLEDYLAATRAKKFLMMVCGPWAMLQASVELARKYGHACLVSMENRMGCGLGVCLGCCIRVDGTGHGAYERVCTEGPVFWAEKVVWKDAFRMRS